MQRIPSVEVGAGAFVCANLHHRIFRFAIVIVV